MKKISLITIGILLLTITIYIMKGRKSLVSNIEVSHSAVSKSKQGRILLRGGKYNYKDRIVFENLNKEYIIEINYDKHDGLINNDESCTKKIKEEIHKIMEHHEFDSNSINPDALKNLFENEFDIEHVKIKQIQFTECKKYDSNTQEIIDEIKANVIKSSRVVVNKKEKQQN